MPPLPPITPPTSYVGPFFGSVFGVGRRIVSLPFEVGGALHAGATAGPAVSPAGAGWIERMLVAIRNFSFNGNTSVKGAQIFPRFLMGASKFNFSGTGLGAALRTGLSGSGYGILALTVGGGLIATLLAARNIMTDFRGYDDASHGRSMEVITNPLFHLGKLASGGVMGAGGLMMLTGAAAGGLPVIALGFAGTLLCKGIEWFNSANNPLNNGGATLWAPFNYLVGAGRSSSINNNPLIS